MSPVLSLKSYLDVQGVSMFPEKSILKAQEIIDELCVKSGVRVRGCSGVMCSRSLLKYEFSEFGPS